MRFVCKAISSEQKEVYFGCWEHWGLEDSKSTSFAEEQVLIVSLWLALPAAFAPAVHLKLCTFFYL